MESTDITGRQYSGITYTFDSAGTEIPQKFTTIAALDYPLLDAKNLDWNDAYLTQIEKINYKKLEEFVGGDKRTRYQNDPDYAKFSDKSIFPFWLNNKRVNHSGEVLDIIDYLISRCIYLDKKVDELEANARKHDVTLIFDENEVKDLGSDIDKAGNIYITITYTIKPNQTNPAFEGTQYEGEYRGFELSVYTAEAIKEIELPLFDGGNGIQIAKEPSVLGTGGGIIDILGNGNVQIKAPSPEVGIYWLLRFIIGGWSPISVSNPALRYPDYIYTAVTIQTPPNENYNASEIRSIPILVKKDDNPFEYVFINNERYFYIAPGTFKSLNSNVAEHGYFFISELNLKLLFGENYSDKFSEYTDDQVKRMTPYLLGDPSNKNSNLLVIPDEKELEIKIYPKYFGLSDSLTQYCGSNDIYTGDADIPSVGDVEFTALTTAGLDASNNIDKVTSTQSTIGKTEFGEKIYEGFSWKGIFSRKDKTVHDLSRNSLKMTITTTPTYYVAKNEINIGITVSDKRNIKFVDKNYLLDSNKKHTTLISDENSRPITEYIKSRDFIKSELNQDTNEWDLVFPIWSAKSWSNIFDINTKLLDERDSLVFPDNQYAFKVGDKYGEGFPMINLNFSSGESITPYKPLIGALVQGDDNSWHDVTNELEIDYESTFKENSIKTNNSYITDWDSQIDWKSYPSNITERERGIILCDHFVRMYQQTDSRGNNLGKYFLPVHTTVISPTDDNFASAEDYPTFKLILKIPENDTQTSASNVPIYNETKLKVNIKCVRAINSDDFTFTGWALLNDRGVGKTKNVNVETEVFFSEIVNCTPFLSNLEKSHTVQTRSTSEYIPNPNVIRTEEINGNTYYYFEYTDSFGMTKRIYFDYNSKNNRIIFLNNPTDGKSDDIMKYIDWNFNEMLQIEFPGIQQADYWFESLEKGVELIINRQMNYDIDFIETSKIIDTLTNGLTTQICKSMTAEAIVPIGQSGTEYNGKILQLTAKEFINGQTIRLYDLISGIGSSSDINGKLTSIYGENWRKNGLYKCIITVQKGSQLPIFWTDRPSSMKAGILDRVGKNGRYGIVYDEGGNVTDIPVENLIRFNPETAEITFASDNFSGYVNDSYVCMDVLFPMTQTYRGLCMKILLRITR